MVVVVNSSQLYSGHGQPVGQFSWHGQSFNFSSYSLLQMAIQRTSSCEQASMQARYSIWNWCSHATKFGSESKSRQVQKSDIQPLRGQVFTDVSKGFLMKATQSFTSQGAAVIARTIKRTCCSLNDTIKDTRCVTLTCSQTIDLFY